MAKTMSRHFLNDDHEYEEKKRSSYIQDIYITIYMFHKEQKLGSTKKR